jgi:hypothetical protein
MGLKIVIISPESASSSRDFSSQFITNTNAFRDDSAEGGSNDIYSILFSASVLL